MKKPKYSDRLIFGLGISGCILGGLGLLLEKGNIVSNILYGVGGLLAGTAWLLTMLNAAYRYVKEEDLER